MKLNFLTTSLCLAMLAMTSNTVSAETIQSAAKYALEKNPEVQAQWYNFVESVSNQKVARAGYLPSVDFNAAYGMGDRDFDESGWKRQGEAEISLTQVLFDGFRMQSRVKQGDYTALKSYYELNDSIERKALEASQAFLDVTRFRNLEKLAQANVNRHQHTFDQIQQRANQGVGNRADLSQAAGRLSLAQTNLMTEQANLIDMEARYLRLVGKAPAKELAPVELDADIPGTLSGILNASYQNNKSLLAALSDTEYARASAQEAKSSLYPKLSFVARTGVYQNRNSFKEDIDPRNYGQDSAVELRLNYNLFNGGADKASYKAATARVMKADDLKQKACIDIRQSASIAYNNVNNLSKQMEWLQRHRDESAAVVKAYSDQFDIGRRSLLDVLDAENEAFQSDRAYSSAQYDLMNAQLQVLYYVGQLLPVLGVQRDNLPTVNEVSDRELNATGLCAAQS